MKKSILFLAAIGLLAVTPSCKKGENDPALSLASRKARITGEWDVTNFESTYTSLEDGVTYTSTTSYDGSIQTTTYSWSEDGSTTTSTSTRTVNDHSWVINKDGSFTRTYEYTYQEEDEDFWSGNITTTTYVVIETTTGTWSFVGKVKDEYKNKERVVFNVLETNDNTSYTWVEKDDTGAQVDEGSGSDVYTNEYYNGDYSMVMDLDRLAGDEMVWKLEGQGVDTDSETVGSTTVSTTDTHSGLSTWTLTKK